MRFQKDRNKIVNLFEKQKTKGKETNKKKKKRGERNS